MEFIFILLHTYFEIYEFKLLDRVCIVLLCMIRFINKAHVQVKFIINVEIIFLFIGVIGLHPNNLQTTNNKNNMTTVKNHS